jgi:lipoate-protein ligase A
MNVISSEVETSLENSGSGRIHRSFDCARDHTNTEVIRCLFEALTVYYDDVSHSASMNMAIDESLLERAAVPIIRFYRWHSPALSFGYFGKFSEVAIYAAERELVRRWTGGGIVLHGNDLTYSIVIPASDPTFDVSSIAIYERVHRSLAHALNGIGKQAEVVGSGRCADRTPQRGVPTNNCFANPVRADVMMDGRKIAGAAQRRTRRGLLQQGSIQGFAIKTSLAQKFAQSLSANCRDFEFDEPIFQRAQELAQEKYGTDSWLHKR